MAHQATKVVHPIAIATHAASLAISGGSRSADARAACEGGCIGSIRDGVNRMGRTGRVRVAAPAASDPGRTKVGGRACARGPVVWSSTTNGLGVAARLDWARVRRPGAPPAL